MIDFEELYNEVAKGIDIESLSDEGREELRIRVHKEYFRMIRKMEKSAGGIILV